MVDSNGNYVLVFNGEIYNFRALREELSKRGHRFETNGDAEVMLAAFTEWGEDSFGRLDGMFAGAIWDIKKRKLTLVRDRLGEKPLSYYIDQNGTVTFASDVRALLATKQTPLEIDPLGFAKYLKWNYVTGSTSIINGIKKIAPGEHITFTSDGQSVSRQYWDLSQYFHNKNRNISTADASAQLTEMIDNAVAQQLVSDVPIGAFLSGGVDSSAIVGSICKAIGGDKTHSFAMGFEHEDFDESRYSGIVAEHLRTVHENRTVGRPSRDELLEITSAFDEPFADTSLIPTWMLAKFARERVSVSLSGDGGDEIFLGYPTYRADQIKKHISWIPGGCFDLASSFVSRVLPVSHGKLGFDEKAKRFLAAANLSPTEAHAAWRQIYNAKEYLDPLHKDIQATLAEQDVFMDYKSFSDDVRNCHPLDRASYVDIKTWLVDDILVKLDRATMAHSLEARVPLLNHRIVQFAAQLPVNYKMSLRSQKYILKKSQEKRLPKEILHRKKRGFNAPIGYWLGQGFSELVDFAIETTGEYFDRGKLVKMLDENNRQSVNRELQLFGIISFASWLHSVRGIQQISNANTI